MEKNLENGSANGNGNANSSLEISKIKQTQNPKKFLFVSLESLSGDLVWQVKKEGHEVKAFIEREEDKEVFDGFIDKADEWEKYKDWADVIVFDERVHDIDVA